MTQRNSPSAIKPIKMSLAMTELCSSFCKHSAGVPLHSRSTVKKGIVEGKASTRPNAVTTSPLIKPLTLYQICAKLLRPQSCGTQGGTHERFVLGLHHVASGVGSHGFDRLWSRLVHFQLAWIVRSMAVDHCGSTGLWHGEVHPSSTNPTGCALRLTRPHKCVNS